MTDTFHPIKLKTLSGPDSYTRPQQMLSEHVTASSPAVDVMTDLRITSAVTVSPSKTVEDALQTMIHKEVRMLLVEDLECRVMGLITANDLQGEKPLLFSQSTGIRRAEVLVRDIMIPITSIEAMDFNAVSHARVGDIVETLTRAGRQHALVIEKEEGGDREVIRGIFSTTQIGRQLGITINPSEKAETFIELAKAIAR
jgi:CBS-domain-containing membrane protein